MSHAIPETHPLHRWFRGLTEWTFLSELGIGDPGLVGYLSDLLTRFVAGAAVGPVRTPSGRKLQGVVAIVAEAESTEDGHRRGEYHRHVGDLALFWTGVYPEALPALTAGSADRLVDLPGQGRRSYRLASDLDGGDAAPVLRRLSDEFDLCALGLARVRREWERHDPHPGPGTGPHGTVLGG